QQQQQGPHQSAGGVASSIAAVSSAAVAGAVGMQGPPFGVTTPTSAVPTSGVLSPQQQILLSGMGPAASAAASVSGRVGAVNAAAPTATTSAATVSAASMLMQSAAMTPQSVASQTQQIQSPSVAISHQQQQGTPLQTALPTTSGIAGQAPSVSGFVQGGLHHQPAPVPGVDAQQQQQQPRMFLGTSVYMPAEIAAEVDRYMASYRLQVPNPADLISVQQSVEQSVMQRYLNMHNANRFVQSAAPGAQIQQQQQQPNGLDGSMMSAGSTNAAGGISVLPQQPQQPLLQQPQQQQQQQQQPQPQPQSQSQSQQQQPPGMPQLQNPQQAMPIRPITPLPQSTPLNNGAVQPLYANAAATGSAAVAPVAMPVNLAQHMALVNVLNKHHVQILHNQLRQQFPPMFGPFSLEQFQNLLVTGQLAGVPVVNQGLVMLVQSIQQQQAQVQQQQQQQRLQMQQAQQHILSPQ
ncbi:hypothetical protein GGI07_005946, partial [Coemansia sp. Benny D115]